MNKITESLLRAVSEFGGSFQGAYNVREDGECAGRQSSEHIKIESKKEGPGLVIHVLPGTKGETVYIPACVTHGGIDDLVYNDFYIGEGADVLVIAGCGVHNEENTEARHNGIHRFFLEKGARVVYREKHLGTGKGAGARRIDPVTDITMAENSYLEMDTVQLGGVDSTMRKTTAVLAAGARLVVRERLMTTGSEWARSDFDVTLEGEDSGVDLISRSVARGNSRQEFNSCLRGKNRCSGHSECDAILAESGSVIASPSLEAAHVDAALIHEAAIGKIAGEQILKLRTLGLTQQEAEERIIQGFLR
ncbi:SufB/SufD family protein [Anaeromassilibacillus sp. An200]|uniref:SufD family Fe-S cluster assembly protein n=1 Tax=Candidatus Caccousia avicola TaxID=2840721 RepID=A0A9D1DF19_9FIRM|nr:SufD family Fe-S cluster assembly protein [Anaeromassilibacillus sp. An200]OUP13777.1 ABC transporter permease [Anaeromassilibacillus sp. An200]HIR47278.1 SufD family Fe-S cluster assembly protein [Candidatus Caccousia avicola]